MNFRTIGLGLATAVAMTTGVILAESPAQAMLSGKLVVNLNNHVNSVSSTAVDFSDIVNNTGIAVDSASTGSFATNPATTIKVKDISPIPFPLGGIDDFLSLSSGATFDLTALVNPSYTEFSTQEGGVLQKVFQAQLRGIFNTGQSGSTPIDSVLAFRFVSGGVNGGSIEITPIPTPALLPGLIGMGAAALRKKRKEGEAEEVLETAEVRA